MPCFDESHTSTSVSLPASLCLATVRDRAPTTETAGGGPKRTAHVVRDSAHAEPEYVWGDEGPIRD
jgi:hypothetical protein